MHIWFRTTIRMDCEVDINLTLNWAKCARNVVSTVIRKAWCTVQPFRSALHTNCIASWMDYWATTTQRRSCYCQSQAFTHIFSTCFIAWRFIMTDSIIRIFELTIGLVLLMTSLVLSNYFTNQFILLLPLLTLPIVFSGMFGWHPMKNLWTMFTKAFSHLSYRKLSHLKIGYPLRRPIGVKPTVSAQ